MIVTALLLLALQGQPVPQTPAKPAPDPDKVICRREVPTGSVMARKVCHTRAEWARQAYENTGAAERIRNAAHACHGTEC